MTVPHKITRRYSWNAERDTYAADVRLMIACDEDGGALQSHVSPQEMLGEVLTDVWGNQFDSYRCREIEILADTLPQLELLVEEAVASIRERLDAIVQMNRENSEACDRLNEKLVDVD